MHVLEGEELGQDAATVEAAFKRHEAISTDVKARVSGVHMRLGDKQADVHAKFLAALMSYHVIFKFRSIKETDFISKYLWNCREFSLKRQSILCKS